MFKFSCDSAIEKCKANANNWKRKQFGFYSPYLNLPSFSSSTSSSLTLDAHTPGRCALPQAEWTDVEWRWRWELRCGASQQTFPPECFAFLWPRRLWRAASCGEPAPCGPCAQPPPCPPVRPGSIDNGDGCSTSATCAAVRNGRKTRSSVRIAYFKFGCNFGKILKL